MISKGTAADIWSAYSEIEKARKLMEDMEAEMEKGNDPNPHDAFGRRRNLTLGVPMGDNSSRLLDVQPKLAISVIRAHIAAKQSELEEANERARIELGEEDR